MKAKKTKKSLREIDERTAIIRAMGQDTWSTWKEVGSVLPDAAQAQLQRAFDGLADACRANLLTHCSCYAPWRARGLWEAMMILKRRFPFLQVPNFPELLTANGILRYPTPQIRFAHKQRHLRMLQEWHTALSILCGPEYANTDPTGTRSKFAVREQSSKRKWRGGNGKQRDGA